MNPGRTITYIAFVVLLAASLGFSEVRSGVAARLANLPASAEQVTPLKAGDRAPAFSVRTVENRAFDFDPGTLERPAIFVSFRGGWCPYCNLHLSELRTVIPQIRELGIDIYFLSGDRPGLLQSSLMRETREDIAGLDYVILSDAEIAAATAFGTAFRVGEGTVSWNAEKGNDIEGSSMRLHGALAVPSVYVIDASGRIVFDFVNADYKVRLPAADLLEAARRVAGR